MKPNFKGIWKAVNKFVTKNSNEILTGVSLGATTGAVIFAIQDTPKAMERIEDKKEELGVDKLTVWETVKTAGPVYIPTGCMLAVSYAAQIGNAVNNAKTKSMLQTTTMLLEQSARDLREATREEVGEKRARKITDRAEEKAAINAIASGVEPVRTGGGNTLFFDTMSGHLMYASVNFLDRGVNEYNDALNKSDCLGFSDLLRNWNVEPGQLDDMVGYNIRKPSGEGSGLVKIYYSWLGPDDFLPINDPVLIQTVTNDSPMGVIHYRNPPSTDYERY